jgi:hypothetical protein
MDILNLSKQLDKQQFKEALDQIKEINDAGYIMEFLESVEVMQNQGTDLSSCIHYSWYDLLIDSDTGKWKPEVENAIERSGENRIF